MEVPALKDSLVAFRSRAGRDDVGDDMFEGKGVA